MLKIGSTCPKCGGIMGNVRYVELGEVPGMSPAKERLKLTCLVCGYSCMIRCNDAMDEEGK